jgi:hypothetical protein
MTTHLSLTIDKTINIKAFVILPLNICIFILNINGPFRAKILHKEKSMRVLH